MVFHIRPSGFLLSGPSGYGLQTLPQINVLNIKNIEFFFTKTLVEGAILYLALPVLRKNIS